MSVGSEHFFSPRNLIPRIFVVRKMGFVTCGPNEAIVISGKLVASSLPTLDAELRGRNSYQKFVMQHQPAR